MTVTCLPLKKNLYPGFLGSFLILFLSACDAGFSNGDKNGEKDPETIVQALNWKPEALSQSIREKVMEWPKDSSYNPDDTFIVEQELLRLYDQVEFQPFWIKTEGVPHYATDMVAQLADLRYDGLSDSFYNASTLKSMQQSLDPGNTASIANWEIEMSKTFIQASHDLLSGRYFYQKQNKEWKNRNDSMINWKKIFQSSTTAGDFKEVFNQMRPNHRWYRALRNEFIRLDTLRSGFQTLQVTALKDSIPMGFVSPEIVSVRKRLYAEIALPTDTSNQTWTPDLLEALKFFQYRHQIRETGKMDTATIRRLNTNLDEKLRKLALNMERMRWLRHDFQQPFIWVNIPKMDMEYVEKDSIQFAMRVVIGRPGRPTPSLDSKIENIVFSPPWIVPPTIMREEVVPGIARRGGSYLARRGLKAYDRRGRVVNASMINSKNFRSFSIGQAPGYRSSLGEVKFNMPNPWSIYMHDTPHREDFVKFNRAYSSGCVRVHKPKEFAAFLLRDSLKYSYSMIDSICKKRKTIFVPMKRQVNVHFVYLTTSVDSAGNVMFLKDVYNWDARDLKTSGLN